MKISKSGLAFVAHITQDGDRGITIHKTFNRPECDGKKFN